MGSGKIASQCARKIFELVLEYLWWFCIWSKFLLCTACHSSCVYHHPILVSICIIVNYLIKYSVIECADAATGMYAELMQRYECVNKGCLVFLYLEPCSFSYHLLLKMKTCALMVTYRNLDLWIWYSVKACSIFLVTHVILWKERYCI